MLLRSFLQVQHMERAGVPEAYRSGILPAFRAMWQREGLYGLFKGNGTHLVKKVPFAAIKFMSYERYKQVGIAVDIVLIMMFSYSHHKARSMPRYGGGSLQEHWLL